MTGWEAFFAHCEQRDVRSQFAQAFRNWLRTEFQPDLALATRGE